MRATTFTRSRRLLSAALAAGAMTAASGLVATPAQAGSGMGCNYPRVCFWVTGSPYNGNPPTASFQDNWYQTLGSRSKGADWVYNSRNDDGAKIYYSGGGWVCVQPDELAYLEPYGYAVAIDIMNSPTCDY
ncbi:hypothetical protein V6V47_00120 [Micromonospora sp. CPCC 205539]|uniref:hypothetical protein n=1 Tax=Micromonospora sp. CPCC 205539 TaxID=3122408 RepID=UPI002FF3ED28